MIGFRIFLISLLITGLLSAAVTRYYFPQVVNRTVTVDHVVEHNNVVTVTRTITQPNGAVESTTTVTDHSTKLEKEVVSNTTFKQTDWFATGLVGMDVHKGLVPIYGATLNRRIFGPVTVGGFGLTNGTIGISVGVTF